MKNTLTVIGFLGVKTAYLNVPREEAIRRYLEENDPMPPGEQRPEERKLEGESVHEFEFEDRFEVYDAWAASVFIPR